MHFHAEHELFFEQRRPLWKVSLSLGLTILVLIANMAAQSLTLSLYGSCISLLLLIIAYLSGHRRVQPAFAWTLGLVVFVFLGGAVLRGNWNEFLEVAARVSCGVLWILWLGTQLDWAGLRQLMTAMRVPAPLVSTMDHALMHGVLTQREWRCRSNAARLRQGNSRLALSTWSRLLGEGALQAFIRLEGVEENTLIRSSSTGQTDSEVSIQLEDVSVSRGTHLVLEALNLQLRRGEWLLVCGSSGTGKSSLLRLIAGLDAPEAGQITRLGSTIIPSSNLSSRLDGRVAFLVQNPEHHFIASTVVEDIAWGLLQRGIEKVEARSRASAMAESLGVGHLLERPCYELSFGEQRRVALAGLLVLEPSLLLLDEPTAGLDPVAAYELRVLVRKVVERTGAACIWATHDLQSYPKRAQRMVLLKEKRIIFDGLTSEGLSRPWMVRAGLAVEKEDT